MKSTFLLILSTVACHSSDKDTASGIPTLGETVQVVPSDGLPPEVVLQTAANNLDVVEHEGEVYLAFRAAPNHFASADAMLHVVRSSDQVHWTLEASIHLGTDLREPRFLSWNGSLFLYFAVLGTNALAFEPQGTMVTVHSPDGAWSEPDWLFENTFIPWRARVVEGVPTLIGYTGGDALYAEDGMPAIEIRWLRSTDGLAWEAMVPGREIVWTGGGSETDWTFLDDGSLVAVMRNEGGDADGFGSRICRAPADDLGTWECASDPKKYDSPLVFRHGDRVWLVGRRNVTETGDYDLGYDDKTFEQQSIAYEADYWGKPKRCSLWEVLPESLTVEWVFDLPSRGDTCFPAAIDIGDGRYEVYNYSSDIEGEDVSWLQGQMNPTFIYRTEVEVP